MITFNLNTFVLAYPLRVSLLMYFLMVISCNVAHCMDEPDSYNLISTSNYENSTSESDSESEISVKNPQTKNYDISNNNPDISSKNPNSYCLNPYFDKYDSINNLENNLSKILN
jgi:hypothetical protein